MISATKRFTALSIVAPAGDNIRSGCKTLETRKWRPDALPLRDLLLVQNKIRLSHLGPIEDPNGVAVALVDVLAVRPWLEEDLDGSSGVRWEPGWLTWELGNIRAVSYPGFLVARRRLYELDLDETLLRLETPACRSGLNETPR